MKMCYLTFTCEFSGCTKLDTSGSGSQFVTEKINDHAIVYKNKDKLTVMDIENAEESLKSKYANDLAYSKYDSFRATLIALFELEC